MVSRKKLETLSEGDLSEDFPGMLETAPSKWGFVL